MKKIPFTRLKIAQIVRGSLPTFAAILCTENIAFKSDKDEEVFIHADIFGQEANSFPPKQREILTDLNKQFCSFDYLMII